MQRSDVLIAGAGPTGLVLALWLTDLGVSVRIVDKLAEPGTTSRALVVHARTLEFYHQIGIAEEVVSRGLKFVAANLWVRGRRVARVPLGDFGTGISPYPFMLIFPQDAHERTLIDLLASRGVSIERPTELVSFDDRADRITAQLRHADGAVETCEATYLAGCDGAHSTVREALRTGFPGGTYEHMFYVADTAGSGPVMDHELHVALDDAGFLAAFPMPGESHARLIGTVKDSAVDARRPLEWNDVSGAILKQLGVVVDRVNWFSTYHVHHRVAEKFREGRAFLLGDAAHLHSPVGAQGMNTGLGDAVNLAWKIAAVVQRRASQRLLDTYEPERIAFAKRLVATTDRAFQAVTSDSPGAKFIRTRIVPYVLPRMLSFDAMRRFMFRTVSQTAIEYRQGALSSGTAGRVSGGDRLPWIRLGEDSAAGDNFAALRSLDWQVHVYGEASADIAAWCKESGIGLHEYAWRDSMRACGFARNAAYLIRPDGYVGCAGSSTDANALRHYVDAWELRSRTA